MNGQSSSFSERALQPLSPGDPAWEADKRRPGAPAGSCKGAVPRSAVGPKGAAHSGGSLNSPGAPLFSLVLFAVWPGLPLVGFEGAVRGEAWKRWLRLG